jgi:hypothetical protein
VRARAFATRVRRAAVRLCNPELAQFFAAQEDEATQSRLPLAVLHGNDNLDEWFGGDGQGGEKG